MVNSSIQQRSSGSHRRLLRFFSFVIIASLLLLPTGALAGKPTGFITSKPSMLTAVMPGVTVTPLLTVGDTLPGGFKFEAIPDGISLRKYKGEVEVFVNHETSQVPFPYNPNIAVTEPGESQNDFDNAQVSRLLLDRKTAGVLEGSFLIDSSLGFQRFCSNYLATAKEGFEHDILFTNEEAIDYVFRDNPAWPPPIGHADEKQVGLVVAIDLQTGQHYSIYGMGRFNHENSLPVPQHNNKVAVLSGDDTFTSGPLTIPSGGPLAPGSRPAQSQLYSYIAQKSDDVLNDEGDLWAFVSDDPNFNDYYDFTPGSTQVVSGHFIQVPKNIATGLNPDGSEMKAADVPAAEGGPFPLPPNNGSWQRDNRNFPVTTGLDGPQWVLEYWSQLNNVFQFVRIEDMAYDKRPSMSNVVYIVDSGRGTAPASAPFFGPGISTNGRVWKMVLDPNDPTVVNSLSIVVEGDNNPVKTLGEVHQPDNIETTLTGILLTEDPGSSQQFPVTSGDPNKTTARLWYIPFSGTPAVVAMVDQALDEVSGYDVDPADVPPFSGGAFALSPGNLGAWETSGIVDASDAFGPGAFLITVQAHTLWVDSVLGPDTFVDTNILADFTYKREGGQLLLIRIPLGP